MTQHTDQKTMLVSQLTNDQTSQDEKIKCWETLSNLSPDISELGTVVRLARFYYVQCQAWQLLERQLKDNGDEQFVLFLVLCHCPVDYIVLAAWRKLHCLNKEELLVVIRSSPSKDIQQKAWEHLRAEVLTSDQCTDILRDCRSRTVVEELWNGPFRLQLSVDQLVQVVSGCVSEEVTMSALQLLSLYFLSKEQFMTMLETQWARASERIFAQFSWLKEYPVMLESAGKLIRTTFPTA